MVDKFNRMLGTSYNFNQVKKKAGVSYFDSKNDANKFLKFMCDGVCPKTRDMQKDRPFVRNLIAALFVGQPSPILRGVSAASSRCGSAADLNPIFMLTYMRRVYYC